MGREALAVIPARGQSKRLPRKNILCLGGRPLISYTIQAAFDSGLFARVLVSTEDEEIAAVGREAGAEIRWRPPELATDSATVKEVCLALLDELTGEGCCPEILCCLYATVPLRTAEDIRGCSELVGSGEAEFSMAVTDYGHPPLQALVEDDGFLRPMWPALSSLRAQDTPCLVVDNGSTYCVRVEAFRRERTFYGRRLKGYWMPRARSIDVNTMEDLALLQMEMERQPR